MKVSHPSQGMRCCWAQMDYGSLYSHPPPRLVLFDQKRQGMFRHQHAFNRIHIALQHCCKLPCSADPPGSATCAGVTTLCTLNSSVFVRRVIRAIYLSGTTIKAKTLHQLTFRAQINTLHHPLSLIQPFFFRKRKCTLSIDSKGVGAIPPTVLLVSL